MGVSVRLTRRQASLTARICSVCQPSDRKFMDLVLTEVEPAACVKKRLNALVSPNPFDMEAIEPFIAFDLKRFRFTDDLDVVAVWTPALICSTYLPQNLSTLCGSCSWLWGQRHGPPFHRRMAG